MYTIGYYFISLYVITEIGLVKQENIAILIPSKVNICIAYKLYLYHQF